MHIYGIDSNQKLEKFTTKGNFAQFFFYFADCDAFNSDDNWNCALHPSIGN